MQRNNTAPTAADLRSDLARHELQIYAIAPLVKMHPARLGQVLRGKLPLTPELARRIHSAIHGEEPRSA
jgi:plasmid maintenance system antidote protein VapI